MAAPRSAAAADLEFVYADYAIDDFVSGSVGDVDADGHDDLVVGGITDTRSSWARTSGSASPASLLAVGAVTPRRLRG